MSDLDFAALLCSRLCHDLVSPVGAINNGLELLEEETDAAMREAVFDLITKSTQQTANSYSFFGSLLARRAVFPPNLTCGKLKGRPPRCLTVAVSSLIGMWASRVARRIW